MRQLPVNLPPERPRREGGGGLFGLACLLAVVFALAWWAAEALL